MGLSGETSLLVLRVAAAMLSVRAILQGEFNKLHKAMLSIVRVDAASAASF
jgi:hypothetical protein